MGYNNANMLYTESTAALPRLPLATRTALALEPKSKHNQLLRDQIFSKTVEVRQAAKTKPLGKAVRVVSWNIERGAHIEASSDLLKTLDADILLLSEMDYGMARSGQHHTSAYLAERLGAGYVYGVEFLELTAGTHGEAARNAGRDNDVGYHGNAIISRAEIKRPALVRLETSGRRFENVGGEVRIGGRLAVLAIIELDRQPVAFASVHLDDRTTPKERADQMAVLLRCLEEYSPGLPVVIAGDLNTFSYDLHAKKDDVDHIRRLFVEDPDRLRHPVPHEPLFELAAQYGYGWQDCNLMHESTQRVKSTPLSLRHNPNKKLDWFLVRGLKSSEAQVIDATPPDIAFPLSDHELISTRVSLD